MNNKLKATLICLLLIGSLVIIYMVIPGDMYNKVAWTGVCILVPLALLLFWWAIYGMILMGE